MLPTDGIVNLMPKFAAVSLIDVYLGQVVVKESSVAVTEPEHANALPQGSGLAVGAATPLRIKA